MSVLVFEDDRWPDLSPLADLTPVPELRFAWGTLADRWRARLETDAVGIARGGPGGPGAADSVLAVNAAALPGDWLEEVERQETPMAFTSRGRVVAARLPARALPSLSQARRGAGPERLLPDASREVGAELLTWPWDVVALNAASMESDAEPFSPGIEGDVDPRAVLLAPERIQIGHGARVDPLAVIDARDGFVRIGPGVVVGPLTLVRGPCDVGEGTELLGGLVARSSIGPQCRIAGEVEECVFQGYANKRHHGFVGHSVVGEWVNLGALTTTSDLKNNYGEVRAWGGGAVRPTGQKKLGAMIGAHVKTGIGTLLPTGASIGVGANLFGGGRFAPKRVPAFAWWDGESLVEHRIEEMLATARVTASRRGRELGAEEERRLRQLHARRGEGRLA